MPQVSTVPLSLVTSSQIHVCGFVQSNFLIVPLIVFSASILNGAKEWWAEASRTPAAASVTVMSARVNVRMGPASLLAWRSGVIEPDASLALVVDEVAVVL